MAGARQKAPRSNNGRPRVNGAGLGYIRAQNIGGIKMTTQLSEKEIVGSPLTKQRRADVETTELAKLKEMQGLSLNSTLPKTKSNSQGSPSVWPDWYANLYPSFTRMVVL